MKLYIVMPHQYDFELIFSGDDQVYHFETKAEALDYISEEGEKDCQLFEIITKKLE